MFFGFSRARMLATIVVLVLTTGCASKPPAANHVRNLQRKLRRQAQILRDMKERNLVLEERAALRAQKAEETEDSATQSIADENSTPVLPVLPKSFDAKATPSVPVIAKPAAVVGPAAVTKRAPAAVREPPPSPTAASGEKTGDHYLYSKVLETYRARKAAELDRTLELLLKSYPDSVFADNAIYLSGLLAFESGDLGKAMKQFDKLLQDYPRSNKAVAALFAKASIEKKTGHVAQAKKGFLLLRDLYPGSPEAARVSVELKLLDLASTKHRES